MNNLLIFQHWRGEAGKGSSRTVRIGDQRIVRGADDLRRCDAIRSRRQGAASSLRRQWRRDDIAASREGHVRGGKDFPTSSGRGLRPGEIGQTRGTSSRCVGLSNASVGFPELPSSGIDRDSCVDCVSQTRPKERLRKTLCSLSLDRNDSHDGGAGVALLLHRRQGELLSFSPSISCLSWSPDPIYIS